MTSFDELKASLEEAVEIKNGVRACPRHRYELADVKAIRAQLNVSQSEMAKVLGTSLDTIKSWETGRRNPTGLAAKVLATIRRTRNSSEEQRRTAVVTEGFDRRGRSRVI
ncbi:Antitoxin HigA-2 [Klebsiella pneumoniae]|nr:Antitoxin HigA-2 [Klebsiella pneumoniae]